MAPVPSPEVAKDGRVTFRFRASNAKQVTVARAGALLAAMQKDEHDRRAVDGRGAVALHRPESSGSLRLNRRSAPIPRAIRSLD
jgi:hypothetical protein